MTHRERDISFRPLLEGDLLQMCAWLAVDHVAEWYPIDDIPRPSLDVVRRHYLPMICGEEPTHPYLILLDNEPIGFIQAYMIRDHLAYAAAVQVSDSAAGVDLFIGDPAHVHRGLGPRILCQFLTYVIFGTMGATECIIGPQPQNASAIRAYEKTGFQYLKTVHAPGSPGEGDEYLMRIQPGDLGGPPLATHH